MTELPAVEYVEGYLVPSGYYFKMLDVEEWFAEIKTKWPNGRWISTDELTAWLGTHLEPADD
jgi:hypothetical protein